jgi:hypothetical protein
LGRIRSDRAVVLEFPLKTLAPKDGADCCLHFSDWMASYTLGPKRRVVEHFESYQLMVNSFISNELINSNLFEAFIESGWGLDGRSDQLGTRRGDGKHVSHFTRNFTSPFELIICWRAHSRRCAAPPRGSNRQPAVQSSSSAASIRVKIGNSASYQPNEAITNAIHQLYSVHLQLNAPVPYFAVARVLADCI